MQLNLTNLEYPDIFQQNIKLNFITKQDSPCLVQQRRIMNTWFTKKIYLKLNLLRQTKNDKCNITDTVHLKRSVFLYLVEGTLAIIVKIRSVQCATA